MTDREHLEALTALVAERAMAAVGRPGAFLVGVTGGVAAGKSTLARSLAERLVARDMAVEVVATDGFLKPNAELEAAGLSMRKGFPETFDTTAFHGFLADLIAGRAGRMPVYSHVTYDVVAGEIRPIPATGVVIVEGINVLQSAESRDRFGLSLYVDAEPDHAKAWYLARLHGIIAADPESFFAKLDADKRDAMFEAAWTHLNLANLREHIAPTLAFADVVIRKGADHAIVAVEAR